LPLRSSTAGAKNLQERAAALAVEDDGDDHAFRTIAGEPLTPHAGDRGVAEFRDAGTSSQRSCSSTVASPRRLAHPTHQLAWIPSGIRKEPPALSAGGWCDQRLAT